MKESDVERLIAEIVVKLNADKMVLAQSVEYGRLTWRKDRAGRIQIKIQPEL
jgi:hypothetical protein